MVQQESSSATPLWTWRELSQSLGLNPEAGPDVFRINTDSRTSKPGDLFVALPGDPGPRFNASYRSDVDGHDYAQNAISSGAVGALVHRDIDLPAPKLVVKDTYDGLWRLGSQAAARMTGTRFAITGSSGKTTAKSFLTAALDAYSAPGSFNNHLGVPLSLSNMPRDTDFGVFEVGTNHPGEILPLAELVQPHVAIVLNVGVAHIENFANQAALRTEKLSIFKALNDPSKAVWEASLECEHGFSFGWDKGASARITALRGDIITLSLFEQTLTAKVPGGGEHRATTLAAIILALKIAEADITKALELPSDLVPAGRGNEIDVAGLTIVDDSYNANPVSMGTALKALQDSKAHRRVAILGEMLELGDDTQDAHKNVLESVQELDEVICVGPAFEEVAHGQSNVQWFSEAGDKLLAHLATQLCEGDRVLVKGSNRVFWQNGFVQALRQRLNK